VSRAALPGPTGLGTSAARMPVRPARGERVTVPPLYGPGAVRDDEPLGRVLDERLVAWFLELGVFTEELDRLT